MFFLRLSCARVARVVLLCLPVLATAAGNVVEYTYDPVGNITQVKRLGASGFAITSLDPTSGPVGTVVTIYGTGFSATPANNAVAFNGTAATVTASASGSISTTVPTGATTGKVTVTVAGQTATSAQDFTVVVPGAPTITSFTPGSGTSGSTVSLSGTNFAVGATTVKLNGVTASATVNSATSLTVTVPSAASSGRFSVTTASGTGNAPSDFLVPPAGFTSSDLVFAGRISAGGPAGTMNVTDPGKSGVVLFDGTSGTYYSLALGQLAFTPSSATIQWKVIAPDNSVFASGSFTNGVRPSLHLPLMTATGTYTFIVSPGAATFASAIRLLVDPVINPGATNLAVATDLPSQEIRLIVNAAANQHLGLGIGALTLSPTSTQGTVFTAYKPDGTAILNPIATCLIANPGGQCDGELDTVAAGVYAIIVQPPLATTASFTAQTTIAATGTLTPDSGQAVSLTRLGQDAWLSFTASSGDSVGVALSAPSPTPSSQSFTFRVLKPDGTTLGSGNMAPPAGGYIELGTLAAAGSYSVVVDPAYGTYGTLRATLKQGALLAFTDSPSAFAVSSLGEAARIRFSGTTGQNVSVGVSGMTAAGSLMAFAPSGAQVGNTISCLTSTAGGRCKVTIPKLTSTGTYSAVFLPSTGVQPGGTFSASQDLTGTLVAGTPQSIGPTREAQNVSYSFAGSAGDFTSLKLWNLVTTPSGQTLTATVYRPDGSALSTSSTGSTTSSVTNISSLPVTGTYTVRVEQLYGAPWQGMMGLDPGVTLAVNGTTATLATTQSEPLRFQFTGTAGQRTEWGIGSLTYSPTSSATTAFVVYGPTGSQIDSISCGTASGGGCESWTTSLGASGTHTISVVPPAGINITGGTIAVSTPATGTLTIGGAGQAIAITRPAQTARYTFSGTAAQLLRLSWTAPTISSGSAVTVSILNPSGGVVSSKALANGVADSLDIASLPSTGTYTVVLDPSFAGTASSTFTLATR